MDRRGRCTSRARPAHWVDKAAEPSRPSRLRSRSTSDTRCRAVWARKEWLALRRKALRTGKSSVPHTGTRLGSSVARWLSKQKTTSGGVKTTKSARVPSQLEPLFQKWRSFCPPWPLSSKGGRRVEGQIPGRHAAQNSPQILAEPPRKSRRKPSAGRTVQRLGAIESRVDGLHRNRLNAGCVPL